MTTTLVIQFGVEHDPSDFNSIPSHHSTASANCMLDTAISDNALVLSNLTLRFIRYPAISQQKAPVSKDASRFQHIFFGLECNIYVYAVRCTTTQGNELGQRPINSIYLLCKRAISCTFWVSLHSSDIFQLLSGLELIFFQLLLR